MTPDSAIARQRAIFLNGVKWCAYAMIGYVVLAFVVGITPIGWVMLLSLGAVLLALWLALSLYRSFKQRLVQLQRGTFLHCLLCGERLTTVIGYMTVGALFYRSWEAHGAQTVMGGLVLVAWLVVQESSEMGQSASDRQNHGVERR
jgi:hypothetical protein